MTLTINLSDEQARALEAKAAAEGLSVEEWIQKLAEPNPIAERPLQTAAEIILSSMRDIPPEIMATMPTDGASQHDHYIYGWPKKEE
jgi:LmbE family N-acetylglucosaminyl deacetylase